MTILLSQIQGLLVFGVIVYVQLSSVNIKRYCLHIISIYFTIPYINLDDEWFNKEMVHEVIYNVLVYDFLYNLLSISG